MWFVICSSINCLLNRTESLIGEKLPITGSFNNNHAMNISVNNMNSTKKTLHPETIDESRSSLIPHKRVKRLHIFRPLFVYRQEKIKRQRIIGNREFRNRKVNIGINQNSGLAKNSCSNCDTCCNSRRRY